MTAHARIILHRQRAPRHGFLRRLFGPSDLADKLRPFVLFDHVGGRVEPGTGFGMHPHSGIATLTYHLDAEVRYEDTTGQNGIVRAGGLEWMRAGGGTWHQGTIHPHGAETTGFQLWLALPPGVEDGPSEGIYVAPEDVPVADGARVLLGTYEGKTNPIPVPSPVTYLDVAVPPGSTWTFQPPAGQRVAWAYVYRGEVAVARDTAEDELILFDESSSPIVFEAERGARFLLGSADKHVHPLVVGRSSVHTNHESLARAEERIREIGQKLRSAGRL